MDQIREHWSSRIGFLMAAIGSAIGLGVLWKFPYTVGENGGSVFLITYFICLILVGIPVLICELALGRVSNRAAVGAYSQNNRYGCFWELPGFLSVFSSFLIMSFYSIIAGWGMSYILTSLNGGYHNLSFEEIRGRYEVLSSSASISIFWHFLFTAITTAIVISGVRKGIERYTKFMTKALLLILVVIFLYATTLSGFLKAVKFIFYPNFANFNFSSAIEALGLAFWTLSLGQGIMISYGSYMTKRENIFKMSLVLSLAVMVVSILISLAMFPVVFTLDLPIHYGPGLIFQTFPYLFSKFPGSTISSTLFFALFVFTALTSAIPLVEVVATNIMERYGVSRKRGAIAVGASAFIFGIPSALSKTDIVFRNWQKIYGYDFLDTINEFVSIWAIPIGVLLSSIFVGWLVDGKILNKELCYGHNCKGLYRIWRFFIRWVVPTMIVIIILQKSGLYNFDCLVKGV